MTVLTSWPIRLDGLTIGTYAHGLEEVAGLHGGPGGRDPHLEVAHYPGEIPEWDIYPRGKVRRYRIWIGSTDANGAITHPEGERGHIEENIKSLLKVTNKIGTPIAFEQDVPLLAGGVETLTGSCKQTTPIDIAGVRALRRVDLSLHFPYPYLHGAQVSALGNTLTFTVDTAASTAPIFDAKVTFKNGTNPRLTVTEGPWAGQYLEWIGSPGASGVEIDCGAHTVRQLPGGTDASGGFRHNRANWLMLPHGDSALSLTLGGGGTVDLVYNHARS